MYSSETSKHRALLHRFCVGDGCDVGFGGDPIIENAIRVDLPQPYAQTGHAGVQLGGDCRHLRWFQNEVLDYVYSSHVLEDFPENETGCILQEWSRVLKVGGVIVLLLPDQQRYLAYCRQTGQPVNPHHAIDHFSLGYLKSIVDILPNLTFVEGADLPGDYSFYAVLRKSAPSGDQSTAVRETLDRALRENRELSAEVAELRKKVDAVRAHPVLGTLIWLRAKLLNLFHGHSPAATDDRQQH